MKRHKLKAIAATVLTLGLALSYNACSNVEFVLNSPRGGGTASQNTVAGNPMSANKIVTSLCNVVARCHPDVKVDECLGGILSTSGFSTVLNLPSSYSSLNSILQAEQTGTLSSSAAQAQSCQDAIVASECSDPRVQAAYDATAKDPYAGTVNLLAAASCGQTFTPVAKYACSSLVLLRGKAIEAQGPVVASQGLQYSVTPSLPTGLSFDSATGLISGTPTALVAETEYTIAAVSGPSRIENRLRIRTADGFLVDSLGDESNTGGATCRTSGGQCTLRAAIEAANASSAAKTIVAPAGTIQLTSRQSLDITKPVEIVGHCAQNTVIDGLNATQVMTIAAGPTTLEKLTIQNGASTDGSGAGVFIGGGASPFTTTVKSLVFRNNQNTGGASGMSVGAGLAVFGTASAPLQLVLRDSVFEGNRNNQGNGGGALGLWTNASATVHNCSFKGNSVTGSGGAIYTDSGALTVSQTLFANNSSDGDGGAVFINHNANQDAAFTNVTFAGNAGRSAGGIYIGAMSLAIHNATFSGNSSASAWYGGALAGMPTRVTVDNSIFSANTSAGVVAHCKSSGVFPIVSQGSNLSDATSSDCGLTLASDLPARQVGLAPLDDYGGPMQTMALLPWSPAIGRGNSATCAAVDQRGYDRLANGSCDIGAFELQ